MADRYLMTYQYQRIKQSWRPLGLVSAITLAAVLLGGTALAQVAALVEPSATAVEALPGQTVTGKVTVQNPGESALDLQVLYRNWTLGMTGEVELGDESNSDASIEHWLDFVADPLRLGPAEARTLNYSVTVPADTDPGTYWGGIFFLSEPSDPIPGMATASIGIQVGHILYVNVPPLEAGGKINAIFEEPASVAGGMHTFLVDYENTGNALQVVEGLMTILDTAVQPVAEVVIKKSIVLPGVPRVFVLGVYGPLPAGDYTAVAVLDYGDEDLEVAGALDFTLHAPLDAPSLREQEESTNPGG